ncbi:hypothetical protein FQR65_LT20771 [Abscondita terminalis]|nr:hypothetical protein FQR65_LT20771 [Abscondita terminalis]
MVHASCSSTGLSGAAAPGLRPPLAAHGPAVQDSPMRRVLARVTKAIGSSPGIGHPARPRGAHRRTPDAGQRVLACGILGRCCWPPPAASIGLEPADASPLMSSPLTDRRRAAYRPRGSSEDPE